VNKTSHAISEDRIWTDLMALAAITEPDRPYTRRSFSQLFQDGRAWLKARFEAAGLTVHLDAGGNLIGRIEGSVPGALPIMLGSHSDSVPSGGRFDGMAGIIAALEVARVLRENDVQLRHPLEVIDFLAEEPSEYGISCVGSRAMAGALEQTMLDATNAAGETLAAAISRIGGDPMRLETARRTTAAGYFELHIEQGIVLETTDIEIGLVTSIAGIARVEIIFQGSADHAGTTPMALRRDAGLAAARLSLDVAGKAQAFATFGQGHFVATTGILTIEPNAANVVPGRARMVFDIRAEDDALLRQFLIELETESEIIAKATNVTRTFDVISRTNPVPCDTRLQDMLADGARANGFSMMSLASGAGHDAAFVASFAPSAMVFIPCRAGRSHTPEEWAEPAAISAGAATLLAAVRQLDGQNS
jgi:N-carbamoyl-L-amino-acid hydrolase